MPPSYEAARVDILRFPDMQAFKDALGDAPPGWQYHHIVNQNPANQENPDINWRLHTTENVVLVPAWQHFNISALYSSSYEDGRTIRDWQSTFSYDEQLSWGISRLRILRRKR